VPGTSSKEAIKTLNIHPQQNKAEYWQDLGNVRDLCTGFGLDDWIY
jgi:hypothetical protein